MTVHPGRPTSAGRQLIPLAVLVLVLGACSPGSGDLGTVAPPPGSAQPSIDAPSPEATPTPSGPPSPAATPGSSTPSPASTPGATTTVRAYFILGSFTGDSGLVPVLRTIPRTQAVGTAAIRQLLAGPTPTELGARPAMFTSIPDGVSLIDLTVGGGIAVVDLTSEFSAGGSAPSVVQRYAQVVYTLSQFPTVTAVRFLIDGQPAPAAITGGLVDGSVGRPAYADMLPAIWVDQPAWGGVLASGASVSGTANVFEAQFRLAVLDSADRVLTDMAVAASCGTGCRGTFSVRVSYTVGTAQWGTLRVYDPSAKDGSPTHVVDYPVWLTP